MRDRQRGEPKKKIQKERVMGEKPRKKLKGGMGKREGKGRKKSVT